VWLFQRCTVLSLKHPTFIIGASEHTFLEVLYLKKQLTPQVIYVKEGEDFTWDCLILKRINLF
jgi:hypothetical protein